MIKSLEIPRKIEKQHLIAATFVAAIILVSWPIIDRFIRIEFSAWLGLLASPFLLNPNAQKKYSLRFGILSLIFLGVYTLSHLFSFFYLALLLALFFVVEYFFGKLNRLTPYLIVAASPITTYFVKVFSFPIRLWLTNVATQLLQWIGLEVQNAGNEITLGLDTFYVEPACTGLKLILTSIILTLFLIAISEREKKQVFNHFQILLSILATLVFVVIANLFRIIGLIIFKIPEDNFSHDLMGLLTLAIYVVLPMHFVIKLLAKRSNHVKMNDATAKSKNSFLSLFVLIFLIVTSFNVYHLDDFELDKRKAKTHAAIDGFSHTEVPFGSKFISENALLYIKPSENFWTPDHNPIICWRGSGYEFQKEEIIELNGQEYFTAILIKGDDVLHTAWWFQNPNKSTTSELEWRTDMALGSPAFDLINITCNDETSLKKEILKLRTLLH